MPDETPEPSSQVSRIEVFTAFLKMGLISFGGPVAHLGYFQNEFVTRRRWVSNTAYADLVALCQFLPGPASSQVGFALGYLRAGMGGAFAAWLGFTLPSALIMIGCAYGLGFVDSGAAWIHGLKIAAVAVVAQALWSMAIKLCPDVKRALFALVAVILLLAIPHAAMQVAVIVAGISGGLLFLKGPSASTNDEMFDLKQTPLNRAGLILFFVLLFVLPLLVMISGNTWVQLADSFYRTGSLVFGGGHVVLPLPEAETVQRGLLTQDQFLAGYGAAQALPGPLFTFAAFLGAVMVPDGPGWLAGGWCLLAILLPSFLLVIGVLPYWQKLRSSTLAQAALRGANAVVVGILAAAFYDPILTNGVRSVWDAGIAVAAFGALQFFRISPWIIVFLCSVAAQIVAIL